MRLSYGFALVCLTTALAGVWGQAPDLSGGRLIGPAERITPGLTYPLDLDAMGLQIPRLVGDGKVDRILHSGRTVYYKLPQAYQHYVPASRTEHKNLTLGTTTYTTARATWGLFKTSFLPDFNANPDFPWETTVGLNVAHRSGKSPYDTVNFLALPEDEDGRLIPVLLLADERPLKWLFPPGTMVGEVIYVTHQVKKYVQEVRTRTKSAENKTWFPGVYRPVRDRAEYQYLTGTAYEPAKKFMSFRNPEEDEVFLLQGTVERLPPLDAEAVKALLARPFRDVTQSGWSPAADQDFHILPKDYSFGLLKPIDSAACAGCHRQTQISVRNLIPREPNIVNNPSKVGNIRGCDAVFSWHPFASYSVRDNDLLPAGRILYLRNFDAVNRLVQVVRRGQIPEREYKLTLYVQESLKPYELPETRYLHIGKAGAMLESVDDGLGSFSRYLPLDPQMVMPAPPITLTGGQVGSVAPVGTAVAYQWKFRSELNPKEYLRDVLVRVADGVIVGAYDPGQRAYVPYDAYSKTLGNPSLPPIPVPEEVKARK